MHRFIKAVGFLVGLCAIAGSTGGAQAKPSSILVPLVAQTLTSNTTYLYGDTSFDFSCGGCGSLEIEAIFNGRGGTEIEILSSNASGIFSNNAGQANSSISFGLTVNLLAGNGGISSVTNILAGSASKTANYGNVTSALSSFSPMTVAGSPTSNLNTPTTAATFSLVSSGSSFSFTDTLSDNSFNATQADTLVLSNVKLLFNPAPEPATIALFATGMAGLAAARTRKRSGRVRPGNSPILGS